MPNEQQDQPQYGSRPIPDPTVLTTQQLYREIGSLKEEIEAKVASLKELVFERFSSVKTQFHASDKAIEAALDAADKAVSKSETSTLKLIDTQSTQIDGLAKNLYDQITDIKARLIRIEEGRVSQQMSQQQIRSDQQTGYTNVVGMVTLVIGSIVGVAGVVLAITVAVIANDAASVSPPPQIVIERQVQPQAPATVPSP